MAGVLTRSSSQPAAAHGFTLIEVLVALAILAIALTSVYRLQGQSFLMSDEARFYTVAPLLAQRKLAEVERQGMKNAHDGSGDFGSSFPGYTWTVRVEEMRSDLIKDPLHDHLRRIEVTVSSSERNFNLRTYRFNAE